MVMCRLSCVPLWSKKTGPTRRSGSFESAELQRVPASRPGRCAISPPVRGCLPNNPIKLSVHPVTHLALARCVTGWPAAYRVR
jgi:hypothetical protein